MPRPRWQPTYRRIDVAQPAAGVDWTQRNDSGGGWLISSVYAELTTSAAVANREPNIRATDGNRVWFRTPVGVVQPASLTIAYTAYGGAFAGSATFASRLIGLPVGGLWLPPGHTIQSVTALIDAADQWANIVIAAIEYPATLPDNFLPSPYLFASSDSE